MKVNKKKNVFLWQAGGIDDLVDGNEDFFLDL